MDKNGVLNTTFNHTVNPVTNNNTGNARVNK